MPFNFDPNLIDLVTINAQDRGIYIGKRLGDVVSISHTSKIILLASNSQATDDIVADNIRKRLESNLLFVSDVSDSVKGSAPWSEFLLMDKGRVFLFREFPSYIELTSQEGIGFLEAEDERK